MVDCAIEEFDGYFPDVDFSQIDMSLTGYVYGRASLFDHWLSEEEAEASRVMFYSQALGEGLLEEYLVGERRFLALYLSLSKLGVVCKYPGPLRRIEFGDSALESVIVNSLREKRSMDIYFIGARVRIVGGHDRTDLLICENAGDLEAISLKVKEAGLFILK
jgi:hypothetical protein